MKTKIVYNNCYGGFGLSQKAVDMYKEIKNEELLGFDAYNIPRYDPILVQVVETLGKDASARFADLQITEIQGHLFRIQEYDGMEWIETPENIDWEVIETPESKKIYPEYFV